MERVSEFDTVACDQRDVDLGVGVELWFREPELAAWRAAAKAGGKSLGPWILSKVSGFVELVRQHSVGMSPELLALADAQVPSKSERSRNWVNRLTSAGERGPVTQEVEDLVTWARSVQRRAKAEAGYAFAPHPLSSAKAEQPWWGHTPPPTQMVQVRLSGTQLVHWSRLATVSGFPDLARWILAAVRAQITAEGWTGWKRVALLEGTNVRAWGSAVEHGGNNADLYMTHPPERRSEWVPRLASNLCLSAAVLAIRGTAWVER